MAIFSGKKSKILDFRALIELFFNVKNTTLGSKSRFLGVKMQMFHIFEDLKFNIIFEFWCKNQDKLTSNILSKMNF